MSEVYAQGQEGHSRAIGPTLSPAPDRRHFHGLDGLRGVAALAVVFLHGSEFLSIGYTPPSASLAVDFFFLLSGFVLACAYDDRLNEQGMTWRRFMTARFVRLYPMLFVGAVLGGVVFVPGQTHRGSDPGSAVALLITACSFFLLPVAFLIGAPATQAYPTNNPIWSLFFEFAVSAVYGSRAGRLGRRGLAAVVAVSAVCVTVTVILWPGSYHEIGFASPVAFLLGIVRVAYPFWAGVLIFRVARFYDVPGPPIGLVGIFLAAVLLLPLGGKIYTLIVILAIFPAIVAVAARARISGPVVLVCAGLGELSYPLYLVHQPVFRALRFAAEAMHLGVGPWGVLVAGAAVSVVAAEAFLIGLDRPVRKWLSRRPAERGKVAQ